MEPAMTSPPYTAAPSDPSAWNPIPHERPKPGTAQDPAKKPKLNITEKFDRIPDDVIASVHLTREDLKLSREDRMKKIVKGFKQESAEQKRDLPDAYEFDEPEYGPDDPLPKGHAWSSFCGDPRYKDFIVKMNCYVVAWLWITGLMTAQKKRGKGTDES